ncbi:MAG: hypothetical protein HY928_14250 [Elusimicrobia bacterium]|nr:hypothetical protein [Elusimicrobiota bacterium]
MRSAGLLLTAAAAAVWGAGAAWAAAPVSHCPDGSRPSRTVDARRPWACVLTSERYRDGHECPSGSHAVTTTDVNSPFKCGVDGVVLAVPRGICPPGNQAVPSTDPEKPYECEAVGKGFMGGPRCPRGTRPVPTPGALQSFKCVSGPGPADPLPAATPSFDAEAKPVRPAAKEAPPKGGACPKGTRRIVTENPFEPVQCVPEDDALPKRFAYKAFKRSGALSFEYPVGWNLTDGWTDAEPAVYIMADRGRDGRPVSLSIMRHRRSSPGYVEIETRVWQEEDWHQAKELDRSREGGLVTIHLELGGEGRLSLIGVRDGYFALAYGAPADLYKGYLPAYERLLKTFRNLETR